MIREVIINAQIETAKKIKEGLPELYIDNLFELHDKDPTKVSQEWLNGYCFALKLVKKGLKLWRQRREQFWKSLI